MYTCPFSTGALEREDVVVNELESLGIRLCDLKLQLYELIMIFSNIKINYFYI